MTCEVRGCTVTDVYHPKIVDPLNDAERTAYLCIAHFQELGRVMGAFLAGGKLRGDETAKQVESLHGEVGQIAFRLKAALVRIDDLEEMRSKLREALL